MIMIIWEEMWRLLCKLAKKICNSGFHGARGFFVEDYQEDVYEKFQVNSTCGLAGRAFRSLHPML